MCLKNTGAGSFSVLGQVGFPADGLSVLDGDPVGVRVHVVWARPTQERWIDTAPDLAAQIGRLKGGGSEWWVAVIAAVGMTGLVGFVLRRL